MDLRVEKLAELLVDYSVAVKPGDKVAIEGEAAGEPLLKAVYARVLQAGGYPVLLMQPDGLQEIFYRHASDEQLKYVSDISRMVIETFDARIRVSADTNTRELSGVAPARAVIRSSANRPLSEMMLERSAVGDLRWVVTNYPTNAYAQDADMSLAEYEDFLYGACIPDMDDPVGHWRQFSRRQQEIIDWLRGKEKVRLTAPGTELEVSIAGRSFINCDGRLNMPDGEIFTGPVEDSMEGTVNFTYPTIYNGREVSGVRLRFEKGRVVEASAAKNEAFLLETLDTDEGSRYVGEFAIGTNAGITRFTRDILFDEKINGSFHMALGAGYPESGSKNRSAIHWDMVCDMRNGGEITVDGLPFYRDGMFLV
jgi:aminopeptidase